MITIEKEQFRICYHEDEPNRDAQLVRCNNMTLDQIEDLEINLTDIIKQLQDYRMKQES